MPTAWRIVREKYAATAFSGFGAQRAGGCFNSVGIPVVYAADSYALAMLEVRIHVPTFRGMRDRIVIEATFDEALVEITTEEDLPEDWRRRPPPRTAQVFGDAWVTSGRSAVLQVPSVVVPGHVNYVLNSAHPDFASIQISQPQPLVLDPRLE